MILWPHSLPKRLRCFFHAFITVGYSVFFPLEMLRKLWTGFPQDNQKGSMLACPPYSHGHLRWKQTVKNLKFADCLFVWFWDTHGGCHSLTRRLTLQGQETDWETREMKKKDNIKKPSSICNFPLNPEKLFNPPSASLTVPTTKKKQWYWIKNSLWRRANARNISFPNLPRTVVIWPLSTLIKSNCLYVSL